MLHINDITYRIAGRLLLENATVHIPNGHKVGLVGRNGTGKTTLFRIIREEVGLDSGTITMRSRARLGYVSQEAPAGEKSLLDTVLAADEERQSLLEEAETATDPNRIGEIHTRLADIDAHTAPARAAAILNGLGFNAAAQARPCSSYSGGWRMRVALAAALFARPDFLLLDEPTNHLDLEAVLWLENYLANWPGTLLVISHERTLLNKVVNEIIHLDNHKLTRYGGNYDYFEKTRREKLVLQSKMQAKQQAQRKHIEAFVERFRYKATKARQAQSRLKMLARMEPIASVIEDRTVSFDFPSPDLLPPPLINMEKIAVGYDGKAVLKNLGLRIDMDDRIGLIGANGNGKSTLIKLLADKLKPMDGSLQKSSKLKIGYFAQHQTDELNPQGTPLSHMSDLMEMAPESKVRAQLGRFGFGVDKADVTVANLSGGEKARLLFALMSREAPHIMLLDEPSNHLDIDSREALIQAINAYEGAVIIVSHDSHLLELVADRLWLVADGGVTTFDGDLEDYKKYLLDLNKQARNENKPEKESGPNKKEQRQVRAQNRAKTDFIRRKARDAEKMLEKLNTQKDKLEADLSNPEIYNGPADKITNLQTDLAAVLSSIEKAEEAWLEASEALETAE